MIEKQALVALCAFVPFGPARIKLFLEYFGSARKVWEVTEKQLKGIGLSDKLIGEFTNFRSKFSPEDYFNQLKGLGIEVITINDKNYPHRLREINDAPIVLYVKGGVKTSDEVAVAIVGSRKVTSYGKTVAEKLSGELAAAGVTIVSGLALGVDGVAHQAALDVGGRTIAVLGNGPDLVYPPSHRELAKEITSPGRGALITEYPLGHQALPFNFPYRNRIISGLSLGVVIIEGSEKSGTLLTASHAASQGREIFAVPGPITSPNSVAPNLLISQGAKLVMSAEDILEELKLELRVKSLEHREILPETEEEKALLELLETEPLHVDEIMRRVELEAGIILSTLTTMELKGIIKNLGSGIYGKMQV